MTPATDIELGEKEGDRAVRHYMQEFDAWERLALGTTLQCILMALRKYLIREHSIAIIEYFGKWQVIHEPPIGERIDDSIKALKFDSLAHALVHAFGVIVKAGENDLHSALTAILNDAHMVEGAVNDFRITG